MTSRVLFKAERLLSASAPIGPVLGLETGTPTASLAIIAQGRLLAEISRPVSSHGAMLPGMVAELLDRAALKLEQLAAVAVGIGPGSFTGLRIGLGYAKGLAWAGGRAIFGINSLDSLALGATSHHEPRPGTIICPILDARKGEVYAALYRVTTAGLDKISDDMVVSPDDLIARIGDEVVFVGEGVSACGRRLAEAMGNRATILDDSDGHWRGMMVAVLAAARLVDNNTDSILNLQPSYVRPPEAVLRSQTAEGGVVTTGTEALWSGEKKSLYSSTRLTTRN